VGRYVRQFEVTVTVDDEPVTATLRQATQEDVLSLKAGDGLELLKGFRERLGNAIVELRGPTDAAGTQIPKDEFLSVAYFSGAVMQIGEKWIQKATPQNPSSPAA
jgi:hypothetical protein